MPDAAISRYHPPHSIAPLKLVPGDSHGPNGPRNDMVVCRWSFCFALAVIAAGRRGHALALQWGVAFTGDYL